MNKIIATSKKRFEQAQKVIRETKIIDLWKSIGAEINIVGSLRMGLMIKNRDIDFHIYTDKFDLSESFSVISKLAQNSRIKRIEYANQLDTDEMCVEWHVWYLGENDHLWQIDMIHIMRQSPYANKFEAVADKIKSTLTTEIKHAILSIKNDIQSDMKISSINVYQAVIEGNVRNYSEFMRWYEKNKNDGIINWMLELENHKQI